MTDRCDEDYKECTAARHERAVCAVREARPGDTVEQLAKRAGVHRNTITSVRKKLLQSAQPCADFNGDKPSRALAVKQRQVSVDINDETWASFKEGAQAEGVSSAAKLGQLIEYHAPSRETEEADSWACIPNAMKEAQLNKRQQQSIKSVLKHFKDRRSQRLLILALEAEWPWMPQLS